MITKLITLIIKNRIVLIWISLTILTLAAGIIFYHNQLKVIEDVSWNYWNTGDRRRGEKVIEFTLEDNRKREFVFTKASLNEPVTTIVYNTETQDYGRNPLLRFETFYLERTGLNSFKVNKSVISSSTYYTFEEAVELAKKYDVYKNNPNPTKISDYPNLDLNEQGRKRAEEIKANKVEFKQRNDDFKRKSYTEKVQIVEEQNRVLYIKRDLLKKGETAYNGVEIYPDNLEDMEVIVANNEKALSILIKLRDGQLLNEDEKLYADERDYVN